jgi:hypothetical protein
LSAPLEQEKNRIIIFGPKDDASELPVCRTTDISSAATFLGLEHPSGWVRFLIEQAS